MILIVALLVHGAVLSVLGAEAGNPLQRQDRREPEEGRIEVQQQSEAARDTTVTSDISARLPEDKTPRFEVKEIRIRGNSLISSEILLKDIPDYYLASPGDLVAKKNQEIINLEKKKEALVKAYAEKKQQAISQGQDPAAIDTELQQKIAELQKQYQVTIDTNYSNNVYDFRTVRQIVQQPGTEVRSISERTILGLTRYILAEYQDHGYAGIYVYVPAEVVQTKEQASLKDNVLVVEVLEAKISETKVQYHRYDPNSPLSIPYVRRAEGEKGYLNESILKEWSPVKENQVTQKKDLDALLRLLNLNPDRYISAVIARGKTSDSLSVDYQVYERSPWHFYVQSDSSGSRERQWSPRVGVINTNLTGRDDRMTMIYQGPIHRHPTDPFDENYSVFGSYDFPLFTPKLRLQLYAGHSNFNTSRDLAGGDIQFIGTGDFMGGMLRYNLFQTDERDPWFLDITGGISHEESDLNETIAGRFERGSNVEMDLWSGGVDLYRMARRKDDYSLTSFSFNQTQSYDGSGKAAYERARTDSDPDFTIYNFSASHSFYLDPEFRIHRLRGWLRWIAPTERLVPAKMSTFGGLYTVRGYRENEAIADGGVLFSAEYEHDLMGYVRKAESLRDEKREEWRRGPYELRKLALVAFTDSGRAIRKNPVPGEERIEELASVGLGVTATLGEHLDMAVYYGLPLRAGPETDMYDGQWSAVFILRW